MPESCRSCGELMAPPHRMTSRLARSSVTAAAPPAPGVGHADGALAVEQDPRRVGVGAHVEVRPRHRGMEIAACRTHPAPVVDGALDVRDTLLRGAVVIGIAGDAELRRAFDEGIAQRVTPAEVGDLDRALTPAEGVVPVTDTLFVAAEIGQHVGITPARIAALGPGVVIHALAAIEDVAVDRARTAEGLAPRHGNGAAAGPVARLGLVEPVDAGIDHGLHEAGGDVDEGVPIRRAGLEDADGVLAAGAQPFRHDAAGRTGTDDDVVECFVHKFATASALGTIRGRTSNASVPPAHMSRFPIGHHAVRTAC